MDRRPIGRFACRRRDGPADGTRMQHAGAQGPGLVHRDLKPANILVNERAQAMVTDFGLVAGSGLEVATPAYMAPSNGAANPRRCPNGHLRLRCILYELFTLHRVFAARTEQEWRCLAPEQQPHPPCAHRAYCPRNWRRWCWVPREEARRVAGRLGRVRGSCGATGPSQTRHRQPPCSTSPHTPSMSVSCSTRATRSRTSVAITRRR